MIADVLTGPVGWVAFYKFFESAKRYATDYVSNIWSGGSAGNKLNIPIIWSLQYLLCLY